MLQKLCDTKKDARVELVGLVIGNTCLPLGVITSQMKFLSLQHFGENLISLSILDFQFCFRVFTPTHRVNIEHRIHVDVSLQYWRNLFFTKRDKLSRGISRILICFYISLVSADGMKSLLISNEEAEKKKKKRANHIRIKLHASQLLMLEFFGASHTINFPISLIFFAFDQLETTILLNYFLFSSLLTLAFNYACLLSFWFDCKHYVGLLSDATNLR